MRIYPLRVRVEAWPGADIGECCREAVRLAGLTGQQMAFDFNGLEVVANPHSIAYDLETEWRRRDAARYRPAVRA